MRFRVGFLFLCSALALAGCYTRTSTTTTTMASAKPMATATSGAHALAYVPMNLGLADNGTWTSSASSTQMAMKKTASSGAPVTYWASLYNSPQDPKCDGGESVFGPIAVPNGHLAGGKGNGKAKLLMIRICKGGEYYPLPYYNPEPQSAKVTADVPMNLGLVDDSAAMAANGSPGTPASQSLWMSYGWTKADAGCGKAHDLWDDSIVDGRVAGTEPTTGKTLYVTLCKGKGFPTGHQDPNPKPGQHLMVPQKTRS